MPYTQRCARAAASECCRRQRRYRADANNPDPDRLGDDELAAPHLIDSEATNVRRRLLLSGTLTEKQGALALEGFVGLTLRRFPAEFPRPRMWELRHHLSAYDATYVALTEMVGATAIFDN
ncbi:type II toxin-antitoxin system VapC family toxin [Paenarthrobacter sp. PH39-S1]|uniref:type II toxin-antitoxin system VapC family toxin n=1 Tax=Paenarthrobacter sp. PH39-S1 TaxID=3046204 RepID=UPI0024B948F1|nr:type II toxin-antitoxin system VapC family toxin [Paenarthrobacter sp. PH39-S1]MDJ0357819.1 type II toxin-antitoxin system VapC family toxin [Paenarthrobacter sp. PH39-S1]